jgi:hypothetical protein
MTGAIVGGVELRRLDQQDVNLSYWELLRGADEESPRVLRSWHSATQRRR